MLIQLDRLMVEGRPPERERSPAAWYAGGALALVGGIGAFIGGPIAVSGLGGSGVRWLWLAVPAVLFAAGVVVLWRAFAAANPDVPAVDRLSDAVTAVLGVTPRTRRRA